MKTLISGHRLHKLKNYNCDRVNDLIDECIDRFIAKHGGFIGMSGMASGVDLWFCAACLAKNVPYNAYVPFEDQDKTMDDASKELRRLLLTRANRVFNLRNSYMVEAADRGIIVWDGNKGGTHNVLQQMIESKKPFLWINPVSEKIIEAL